MIFETVTSINNRRTFKRVKTSIIIFAGISCVPLGILLLSNEIWFGGTLILTAFPCFLIYPFIRFLFFGGKDSVAAVVTTVVVEEVTKASIKSALSEKKKPT